jgi:hypothetical protein
MIGLDDYSILRPAQMRDGKVSLLKCQKSAPYGKETLASWLDRHPQWDFRPASVGK